MIIDRYLYKILTVHTLKVFQSKIKSQHFQNNEGIVLKCLFSKISKNCENILICSKHTIWAEFVFIPKDVQVYLVIRHLFKSMSFLWIKYWNTLTFIMTDRNMKTCR